MAVLIDPPSWQARGRRWSHLASDSSVAELHAFAAGIGVPRRGFEGDHYDVPEERYAAAIAAGAIPVSTRELLRRLQGSGLRRPKRRGERVLASRRDPMTEDRVDVLLSTKAPTAPVTAVLLVAFAWRSVLCLIEGEGLLLPRAAVGPAGPDAATSALAARLLGDVHGESRAGPAVRPAAASAAGASPLGASYGGAAQVGYLRRIGPDARPAGGAEVVLRWWVPWSSGPPPARDGAWVDLGVAVALLPADVAPLVRAAVTGRPDQI